MKNMLRAGMVLVAIVWNLNAAAQCGGPRYIDTVFASITVDSVIYSTPDSLKMDIYQPAGDTASLRPLIVLAHGGSFVGGDREDDNAVTGLCADLAHKGYVTASIDYRLATIQEMFDSVTAMAAVMRTISDAKAAVRFFYKDAYNSNIYKIDTSRIFIGGNSAGAVLAMHYAYIDSLGEVPAYMQTIITNNGGMEGNSGNPGYSSAVRGVINLAGGLHSSSWMGTCSLPVVSAHGDQDLVVPYNCAFAQYGYLPVTLCGLGALQPYITANTPYFFSLVFPGDQHVPWQGDAFKFYKVDTLITNFLYRSLCSNVPTICQGFISTGVNTIIEEASITLYPNPASDVVTIKSSQLIESIFIYDAVGRLVGEANAVHAFTYRFNTSRLGRGMYLTMVKTEGNKTPILKKIAIE